MPSNASRRAWPGSCAPEQAQPKTRDEDTHGADGMEGILPKLESMYVPEAGPDRKLISKAWLSHPQRVRAEMVLRGSRFTQTRNRVQARSRGGATTGLTAEELKTRQPPRRFLTVQILSIKLHRLLQRAGWGVGRIFQPTPSQEKYKPHWQLSKNKINTRCPSKALSNPWQRVSPNYNTRLLRK